MQSESSQQRPEEGAGVVAMPAISAVANETVAAASPQDMLTEPEQIPYVSPAYLTVGNFVDVAPRTWPGINQLGGVGCITKTHEIEVTRDGEMAKKVIKINVKYTLGGRENDVDVRYVKEYVHGEKFRDRSKQLGRCTRCGSHREDCNSCDWVAEQQEAAVEEVVEVEHFVDSDEEERVRRKVSRAYNRLRRSRHKRRRKLKSASKTDEDQLDDEDMPLAELEKQKQKQQKANKSKLKRRRTEQTSVLESLIENAAAKYETTSADQRISVDEFEFPGSPTARSASSQEQEKMHTPRQLDEDDNAVEEEKLLTPIPLDDDGNPLMIPRPFEEDEYEPSMAENSSANVDGNDEISFHGDEDDSDEDDSSDEEVLNDLACTQKSTDEPESSDDPLSSDESYEGESRDGYDENALSEKLLQISRNFPELLKYVDELVAEVSDNRLSYANQKLLMLKSRLTLVKNTRNAPLHTIYATERVEIDLLEADCEELHQYVVHKLYREGIDEATKAIKLLGKIKPPDQRSRALRSQCDLRLYDLIMRVPELDRKVTAVQVEVDDLIDELIPQESSCDAFGGDRESDVSRSHQSQHPTKRKSSGAHDDRHRHASKRRKTSSTKRQGVPTNRRERQENATARKANSSAMLSTRNAGIQIRDGEGDTSLYIDSMHVDSIGETDEHDDQPVPSRTHASGKVKQARLSTSNSRKALQSSRRAQPATSRASTNARANPQQRMGRANTTRDHLSQSRLESSINFSKTNVANLTNSNDRYQDTPKSTEQQVHLTPPLPSRLRARDLFQSLSNTTKVPAHDFYENEISPSPITRSVDEICQLLAEHYPRNLNACSYYISDLSVLVRKELPENDAVIMFNTMMAVFQKRCSSFIDLIRSDPKDACFQIRCWILIFKMLGHGLQNKLKETDGVLYNMLHFPSRLASRTSKTSPLASHIILQMIDCLYSQLLWRDWGKTPRFNDNVFECMALLRDQIDVSFPIFEFASDLLRSKFVAQSWHRSKLTDEKENDTSRLYFVSSITPDDHVQLMSTGQQQSRPEVGSRLTGFGNNISRKEIDALWSIVGWFANTPTLWIDYDTTKARSLLSIMTRSSGGILPEDSPSFQLPPNPSHIEQCRHEIGWIATLISSQSLTSSQSVGNKNDLNSIVTYLIDNAVRLESRAKKPSFSSANTSVDEIVSQYWNGVVLKSDPQREDYSSCSFHFDLQSLLVPDKTTEKLILSPSTHLLQVCTRMLQVHATKAIQKRAQWNRLYNGDNALVTIISGFKKDAAESDTKTTAAPRIAANNGDDVMAQFASSFGSDPKVDQVSRKKEVEDSLSAYLQESSCFIILSCIIAISNSNSSLVRVDKDTRKKLLQLMCDIEKATCSNNLSLLFTAAKMMSISAALHLSVDSRADPTAALESFDKRLGSLGLDDKDDANMLEYLMKAIVTHLRECCHILESFEKENLDSIHTSIEVIRSITIWITFLYHRAQLVLFSAANGNPSPRVLVIVRAISKLGSAEFSFFIVESLNRVLTSIIRSIPSFETATLSSILRTTFRSSLVAMKSVVGLANLCHNHKSICQDSDLTGDYSGVYIEFRNVLTTRAIPSMVNQYLRSHKLCRDMSGALMSTYASMCTLPLDKSVYKDAYNVFILATDAENQVYLRQLRACFSSELTRLGNPRCNILVRQQAEPILSDLISSLIDIETLWIFPTSNIELLIAEGGKDLRKEIKLTLATSRSINQESKNPDEEAILIVGNQDKYMDTVGSNYTSQHIWSHCNQVAALLSQNQVTNPYEQRKNTATDCSAVAKVLHEICAELFSNEDLLEGLSFVSFERECLKRMIVIRALLKVDRVDRQLMSSSVMHCIFENMYNLTELALYYEKQRVIGCSDKESRLERGKAVACQKAYLIFSGSLLSCLLRDNLSLSTDQSAFMREFIPRVLKKEEDIRSLIEDAHRRPFLQFHLRKKVASLTSSEKAFFQTMSSDLACTLLCRADDLLLHDVRHDSKGFLYSMLTTPHLAELGLRESFTVIANQLVLKPRSMLSHSPQWKSRLQMAINLHVNHTEACRSDRSCDNSRLIEYRESVLSPFLSKKLNDSSPVLRKASLQLLTRMLITFSSNGPEQKIYNSEGNLVNNFMTYVEIARSLKVSLETNKDSTDDLKACANALLLVPVSTGNVGEWVTLLHATSFSTTEHKQLENKHLDIASYLVEFNKWLHNPDNPSILESLAKIERELFPEEKKRKLNDSDANCSKQKPNNPYSNCSIQKPHNPYSKPKNPYAK